MYTSFYRLTAALLLAPATLLIQQESFAQKQSPKEEIIIKKKAGSDEKTTIVIDGDKVTVNGKPITELDNENIIIKKRSLPAPGIVSIAPEVDIVAPVAPAMPFAWAVPPAPAKVRVFAGPGENEIFMNSEPKAMLGVYTEKDEKGAKISEVVKGSPAEKAGLQKGDIITKAGGKTIADPAALSETIEALNPGDETEIVYLRDKKERKVKVKLGERKQSFSKNFRFEAPEFNEDMMKEFRFRSPFEWDAKPKLGIRIQDTEEGNGVKVLDVQEASAAEKSGIKKDDIITSIDGKDIKSADEAKEKIAELKDKSAYPVKVLRDGAPVEINVKIPKKLKTTDL
ncbi:MAG: PDZ domain-containing protein [Chitinophagaceae bacterium]|nr:PDZ domain-containing protein [Chitinophagaceae bacterium]